MKKYASPLRLTWDWAWPPVAHPASPHPRPAPEVVRAVGAEIVRSRVLMLEVGYPDPEALLAGELTAALAGYEGSLALVLTPAAAAVLALKSPGCDHGAGEIWVDMTPVAGTVPEAPPGRTALRYYLTAENFETVAAGIERALAGGASAISLPNLPLFGGVLRAARTATPTAGQLTVLAGRIAAALRGRPPADLRVHHYGLCQALRAAGVPTHGEGAPGAGCQAGGALAYVDPAGTLYPCASLPVPLARVSAGAIGAAWSGPVLAALREGIARTPAACALCPLQPTCRGGCRGWAHWLAADWETVGPDCARA